MAKQTLEFVLALVANYQDDIQVHITWEEDYSNEAILETEYKL